MTKLLEELEKRQLSKLQLGLRAGVAPSDLYRAINGDFPFYPKYRKKICAYLEMDEKELFEGNRLK